MLAQHGRLMREDAVGVDRALGRAGAARGEEDRRRPRPSPGPADEAFAVLGQVRQSASRPSPPPPHRDQSLDAALAPTPGQPRQMRLGRTDEGLGLGLGQTAAHVPPADARVDEDRHRAAAEEREGQRDELDAGRHQQRRAHARAHADALQARGQAPALGVQLLESDGAPAVQDRGTLRHAAGRIGSRADTPGARSWLELLDHRAAQVDAESLHERAVAQERLDERARELQLHAAALGAVDDVARLFAGQPAARLLDGEIRLRQVFGHPAPQPVVAPPTQAASPASRSPCTDTARTAAVARATAARLVEIRGGHMKPAAGLAQQPLEDVEVPFVAGQDARDLAGAGLDLAGVDGEDRDRGAPVDRRDAEILALLLPGLELRVITVDILAASRQGRQEESGRESRSKPPMGVAQGNPSPTG